MIELKKEATRLARERLVYAAVSAGATFSTAYLAIRTFEALERGGGDSVRFGLLSLGSYALFELGVKAIKTVNLKRDLVLFRLMRQ